MVYSLKGRLLKNLLVFLRKIEDLTFFSSTLSEQRGKRQNSPFEPRLTPSAKIEHVGVYFAKTGCEIEDGFTDIFGGQVRCLVLDWTGRLGLTFTTGLFIKFAAKREKWLKPFAVAQPSLFFPYFDFTLMNVYMNTGIK